MTKICSTHFIFLLLLPCLTYFLHECTHLIVYRLYGINASLAINTIALPQEEMNFTNTQKIYIYGSGVFFSLLQGIFGFVMTLKKESFTGFLILLSAAVFRWAATIQGVFSSSDEIKISQAMNNPDFVWPLIISSSFFLMIFYVYKERKLPKKSIYGTGLLFLLITYFYSLI